MARAGSAPEMESYTDKVRTSKDGTKRYYRNGLLHRDPYAGPAIEDVYGSGTCYVNGIQVDAVYLNRVYFESNEAMIAASRTVSNMETETGRLHTQHEKPVPKYLPSLAPEKPRNRDHFDKMGGRLKGTAMSDLQKLYAELSNHE